MVGLGGGERRELVAVCEEERDLEFGIRGGVFGMAGGKRFTVCGQGEWGDRKEHEEIIVVQGGNNGPLRELKTHGNGLAVEPRTQGLDPPIDRFRPVLKAPKLSSRSAGGLEADSVFGICPVETNERGKCFMSHLPACASVVPRDMPACVLRRH